MVRERKSNGFFYTVLSLNMVFKKIYVSLCHNDKIRCKPVYWYNYVYVNIVIQKISMFFDDLRGEISSHYNFFIWMEILYKYTDGTDFQFLYSQ